MPKLILSDMDGTLTKGSIILDHAGYLIQRGYMEDDGSYEAWVLDPKNERLIVNLARSYQQQLIGLTLEQLHVKEFVKAELADTNKWYETLKFILNQRDKGNRVIIVSGSADYLVNEVARQLDVEGKGTIYHSNEGVFNGKITPMFNEKAKREYIEEHLNLEGFSEIIALGDTSSDCGLFQFADYNILVDPTIETMTYIMNRRKDIKINQIVRK